MPKRLNSVLKTSERAMGSPRNTYTNITFASKSVYTASLQRPYIVHKTFPQRLYSVHDASTARKKLLQRVCRALMSRLRRAYSVLMAFKIFFLFSYFEKPYFATMVIYFDFSKLLVIVCNSCYNVESHAGLGTCLVTHIY